VAQVDFSIDPILTDRDPPASSSRVSRTRCLTRCSYPT